jgi:sulfite reductase (NADPH) hemoprotein beta-component
MRQWSTFHPEFAHLPRKFKIAITGATNDRAAVAYHDIGIRILRNDAGETGAQIIVGGGLGRTPVIGEVIQPWIEKRHLLSYCEAILRVYNLHGDRENKYKARIKILVKSLGIEEFRRQVDAEWECIRDSAIALEPSEIERVSSYFVPPVYAAVPETAVAETARIAEENSEFRRWLKHNTLSHRVSGYRVAFVSLKSPARPPGDVTDTQMESLADLADQYSMSRIRSTHDQNLVLSDVREDQLFELWQALTALDLATANIGTLTDLICCPGLDFCALANAGSIGVAKQITDRFNDLDYLYDLGEIRLKMSGCINACGHHHIGHIGILGINKAGEEYYQIMLGGSAADDASLGKWIGPAIAQSEVANALERMLTAFAAIREGEERFLDTYRRVGATPFKEAVYGA